MAEFKECEVIMRLSPKVGYDPIEGICVAAEKVAELVRCKDCKYYGDDGWGFGTCQRSSVDYLRMADKDFCSKGVRREVEE